MDNVCHILIISYLKLLTALIKIITGAVQNINLCHPITPCYFPFTNTWKFLPLVQNTLKRFTVSSRFAVLVGYRNVFSVFSRLFSHGLPFMVCCLNRIRFNQISVNGVTSRKLHVGFGRKKRSV